MIENKKNCHHHDRAWNTHLNSWCAKFSFMTGPIDSCQLIVRPAWGWFLFCAMHSERKCEALRLLGVGLTKILTQITWQQIFQIKLGCFGWLKMISFLLQHNSLYLGPVPPPASWWSLILYEEAWKVRQKEQLTHIFEQPAWELMDGHCRRRAWGCRQDWRRPRRHRGFVVRVVLHLQKEEKTKWCANHAN